MEIDYKLENAGWAIVKISNGYKEVVLSPSYLHDSLKNLAESALQLKTKNEKTVVFMDEPGEHWLVLKKADENTIDYEVRWYEHWASKNLVAEDDYKIVLTGTTTLPKYINQVRKNLIDIYEEFGPELYKEKWIMHDFPMCEYKLLK
ncbi:hypothetical protein [Empedobacter sedimenti]|uniref:hypothetical protein n=1 Tax=Empedobacter sedimenti TaxID=3042610 RepID=UPI0024A77E68|nr:hypothetical protein [Empedobacter sedimenti]